MIQSAVQKENENTNMENDVSVIFCIDISGSMSSTFEIPENSELKCSTVSQAELDELK